MSFFGNQCAHAWEVRVTSRARPLRLSSVKGLDADEFARLCQGCVTVLLTCSKCGKIETREMLGEVEG